MRKPPFGMMARFSGASVWSPTMTSLSLSMYPGACAVIELGIWEMSRTPFLRSSTKSFVSVSQICFVRGVAGAEEGLVALVGRVVQLDEGPDVELPLPEGAAEPLPGRRRGSVFVGCCDAARLVMSRRQARRPAMPSSALVCRAIISSSLVGITHAETRLSGGGDPRSVRGVGARIERHAEPRRRLADAAADLGGVLADPGGEDQRVDAAEHGGERADLLRGLVDEVVDREARRRIGAGEQVAHVVADARDAEQPRLLVEQLLHLGGRAPHRLEEMEDHARIDRARAGAHAEPVERGEAEGAVDALPRPSARRGWRRCRGGRRSRGRRRCPAPPSGSTDAMYSYESPWKP